MEIEEAMFKIMGKYPSYLSTMAFSIRKKVFEEIGGFNTFFGRASLGGGEEFEIGMELKNPYWFSYPGYSEMLVGYVDLTRNSNNKENNPNITVLEYIHNQPGYNNKVAAFCSWDVFDFIINEERSGIYVNAGMESYEKGRNNPKIGLLNEIMLQIPVPWKSVRYDAITHNFAKTYLEELRPKFGENK